jgi:hypothetical protein
MTQNSLASESSHESREEQHKNPNLSHLDLLTSSHTVKKSHLKPLAHGPPNNQTATIMAFTKTAKNIRIDNKGVLHASLEEPNHNWVEASFDLTSRIANDNGKFTQSISNIRESQTSHS